MKNVKILLLLLFGGVLHAGAQTNQPLAESSMNYFNGFQNATNLTYQADSALYFARKLASDERFSGALAELLHNSFAQAFESRTITDSSRAVARRQREVLQYGLLLRMKADTNRRLREAAQPIFLWTEAMKNRENDARLEAITKEFMQRKASAPDDYLNRLDRYGLMIYQIVAQRPALKPLATDLFKSLEAELKENQMAATDSSTRAQLEKRAYYRYLYAFGNYVAANATSDGAEKESRLKTAFTYSPDLVDQNHKSAYFYDMFFLNSGEEKWSFQEDYLDFLMHHATDKKQVIATLTTMALARPAYKDRLKNYYEAHQTTGKDFGKYWFDAIDASAKAAPPISLALLNKESFSDQKMAGKWILVDFWGTWCMPCRQEHPALQSFYDSTVKTKPEKIALLTIACRDTEPKVRNYMEEKSYTFPVAMSDNKIENTFAVGGYPTKLLVTPAGKYVIIPFNSDWVSFIKEYTGI